MRYAINLNYNIGFRTEEVRHERSDWMLAAEFDAQRPLTKQLP
jgi:hypothetical protein